MPLLNLSVCCPEKSICKSVSVHHQLIQVHEKPVRHLWGLKHHFIFWRFIGMSLLSSSISWSLPLPSAASAIFLRIHQATPRLHLHITFVLSTRSFFLFCGSCLTRKFHVESFYYPSPVKCKFSFILLPGRPFLLHPLILLEDLKTWRIRKAKKNRKKPEVTILNY